MALTTGAFLGVVRLSGRLHFSLSLLFLFWIVDTFALCHLIFKLKDLYDFLYKKRYILAAALLAVLVAFKFHGGSVGMWDMHYIEPEEQVGNNVLGHPRAIRSDDWLVLAPATLSQATEAVQFSSHNGLMRATDNLVTMFPNLPSKDVSILATPQYLGYLFLDAERAYSLAWYLPYFIIFFSTFELLMILTKKRKLYALAGAIMVTFSTVIQWWQPIYNVTGYGALAAVLFYYLLRAKKWQHKLGLSVLFGYAGFLYVMVLYPAWQVPYGYAYLAIMIWMLIQNKTNFKKKDLLYLIPTLLTMAVPLLIIFLQNREVLQIVTNTVYPGQRFNTGGDGPWTNIFTYTSSVFWPYNEPSNPCHLAQYISLFPIPIIFSIYLMIKNKKKDWFLILCNTVLIGLSLWVVFPLPAILSKVTLMYVSTSVRAAIAVGYLSVIEIFYLMSHYEIKRKAKKLWTRENLVICLIALASTTATVLISNEFVARSDPEYITLPMTIAMVAIYTVVIGLLLYNRQKTNCYLALILIVISLISGATVHPVVRGLNAYYDKPLAQKVQELVREDPDAIFMAVDTGIVVQDYLPVNGAKTINSVNYVPNLELYHQLDPEQKDEEIYNRYEHLVVGLTHEETKFELLGADAIKLHLNTEDVCKLGVKYIVTYTEDLSEYSSAYTKIYGKYQLSIWDTGCN